MGSSCISGKKILKNIKLSENASSKQDFPNINSKGDLEIQNLQKQKLATQSYLVDSNSIVTREVSQKQNLDHSLNFQLTNKFNSSSSQLSHQFFQFSHTPSALIQVQEKKKISFTEVFILERKRLMNEKGVFFYTPYTILPAPKLKSLQNNELFKRRCLSKRVNLRFNSLQNLNSQYHPLSQDIIQNFQQFNSNPILKECSSLIKEQFQPMALLKDVNPIIIKM